MSILNAVFAQGTHASRPAAASGNSGYYYFETDTLGLFQSTGSVWTQVAYAPGSALGLTGATAATRYVGATASGHPTTGTFAIGDFSIDQSGSAWICTGAGSPGTWVQLTSGGGNVSTYTAFTADYGELQRLTHPIVSATYGDHFNAATLDPKWGAYSGSTADWNTTDLQGWAHMNVTNRQLVQAVPAGSWTIECEVMGGPTDAAAFGSDGLIVSNAATQTTSTDMRLGFGYDNSLRNFRVVWENWINGAYNSAYAGTTPTAPWGSIPVPMGGPFFLQLQWDSGAAKFYSRWSVNGRTWVALTLGQPVAPGFTPSYFGIFGGVTGAYFNYFDKVA